MAVGALALCAPPAQLRLHHIRLTADWLLPHHVSAHTQISPWHLLLLLLAVVHHVPTQVLGAERGVVVEVVARAELHLLRGVAGRLQRVVLGVGGPVVSASSPPRCHGDREGGVVVVAAGVVLTQSLPHGGQQPRDL